MKSYKLNDTTASMLKDLAKKSSMKEEDFLDQVVNNMCGQMKRTGKRVL